MPQQSENPLRGCLLVVDDDVDILAGLQALLSDEWDVYVASTGREALAHFAEYSPDVVLLDVQLPDYSGIELLGHFKMYSEATAVIMMSGVGTLDRVTESMKQGAETFLQKPFDSEVLLVALEQVSRMIATRREIVALRRTEGKEDRLPGISPAVAQLNELLGQIAPAISPVLIEGESGTGKGILARMIHNRSHRARSPFVDLNCAGLSKELLESELFGHERGAFTNAMNTKQGLFEVASDGTLFLDEIGEMDLTVQARLLKAIEEKRFRRVGGIRDLRANFRLIAATNRDLATAIAEERFRSDLYYRLNVVRIRMPALRERMEDVPVLAQELLRPLAREMGRPVPELTARALKKLMGHPWPGNVRELRNVLERAMLVQRGKQIQSEDLALESGVAVAVTRPGTLPRDEWDIRPLEAVMAQYVAAAVEATDGNMRKAARLLDISPSTLYSRLKDAGAKKN